MSVATERAGGTNARVARYWTSNEAGNTGLEVSGENEPTLAVAAELEGLLEAAIGELGGHGRDTLVAFAGDLDEKGGAAGGQLGRDGEGVGQDGRSRALRRHC